MKKIDNIDIAIGEFLLNKWGIAFDEVKYCSETVMELGQCETCSYTDIILRVGYKRNGRLQLAEIEVSFLDALNDFIAERNLHIDG